MFKRILTYSILSLIALGGFFGNVNIDIQSIHNISEITVQFTTNNTYADENGDGGAGGSMGSASTDTKSTDPKKDVLSTASLTMYNNLIDNINIVLGVLSTMITPIILFVGWLMSPDWTSGDLFGLRAPMYALWVTVSNIVYFIYAILLIIIALGTMFGHGTFSYKVMLPKLALGIIMVPFTWWFVQWTISISSVVTATVMTMPADTIGTNDSIWFTKPSIPTMIVVDNTGTGTENLKSDCSQAPVSGPGCLSPKDFIKNAGGMYSPLIIYGYSIFKFEKIKRLEGPLDIASAALQIVHTSIISTIMFAVFGLLTITLAAMLLMRAMKLWMYAIFAPLFTFRFVAGSNLLGGKDDSFSIKEFIGLAFIPAVVGLTLSFGLIIINAVQGPTNSGPATSTSCNLESEEGCVILNIMGGDKNKITRKITKDVNNQNVKITSTTFAFGGVEFYFLGKATNQTSTTTNAAGAIDALGGMFGTLIIDVIALVFIWMSFMAAKKVSTAVEAAFKPFEDIGSQVGNLAKSIPKYTPIPGLGMSANSIGKVVTNAENAMIGASDKKFKESAAGKLFGGERVVATVDEKKLSDALKDANRSSHNGFKIAGDQIEKQNGKDIEYSSMFKDLVGSLKQFTDRNEKIRALETAGYSNDNARKIVDQLINKTNNEFDKNDATLMAALKSRIGTPASGTGSGGGTSNITVTNNGSNKFTFSGGGFDIKEKTSDEIFTEINKNPTNFKGMTDEQIKETLKKMAISDGKVNEFIKKVESERTKKTS